ncbi:hypothetical protein [Pedobacter mucosus]|uniref:hypothetical protein n=1 Tax=Pedobacter mucosus TaxID=2895286 RepID=UPI001EE4B4D1|nr:hypothetical protein [Pedobacter mucosus]UKT64984.1 hypothetical protein LOK61_04220 [Pedobacter mucosus]
MGIALAAIGNAPDNPLKMFMPDWLMRERKGYHQKLGAEVILIRQEEGGIIGSIKLDDRMAGNNQNIFLQKDLSSRLPVFHTKISNGNVEGHWF